MPSISEIEVAIRVNDAELGRLDEAGRKIDAMGQRGESVGRSMQVVGLGMTAVAAAGGVMFGAAFKSAADFEQSMDFVGAALGGVGTASGVTEAQFASLSAQAQELGSTTKFTAGQVASVQEELGKSGVSAEALLSGATDAVLSLSAATGEDLVTSAQVAAGAMNTFGLSGDKMGYVADVVTGALNNSSMSLKDFNTGMGYLGPTLAQTGGDFDDAAAAIAYFSKQGMKGADAGVSLNRMVDNLVRPKNLEAAKLFEKLGISAFDSTGQLKPIPDMLDNINDALSGLSEQDQLELVSKLFGAESADVVLRALSGAGDGIRQMEQDITQSGIAATQAAQRMDNFWGDVETLGGAVDSAGQKITSAFLPAGRAIVQFATSAVTAFGALPVPIQATVGAVLGLGSAVTAGIGGAMLTLPKIVEFKNALTALGGASNIVSAALTKLPIGLGPISIALAAGALAVAAYQNNWLHFREIVDSVAQVLSGVLQNALKGAAQFMDLLGDSVQQFTGFARDSMNQLKGWADMFARMNDTFTAISQKSTGAGKAIDGFGMTIKAVTGIDVTGFFGKIADAIDGIAEKFNSLKDISGDAFNNAATSIGAAAPALVSAAAAVGDAIQSIKDTFAAFNIGELPFGPAQAAIVALSASMFAIVPVAQKFITVMRSMMTLQGLGGVLGNLKGGFAGLVGAINPVSAGFAAVTLAVGSMILLWKNAVDATAELNVAMGELQDTINGLSTTSLREEFRSLTDGLKEDLQFISVGWGGEGTDAFLSLDARIRDYAKAINQIPPAADAAGISIDKMSGFAQFQDDLLREGFFTIESLTQQYDAMNKIMTSTAPNADLLNQKLEEQMQLYMQTGDRDAFLAFLKEASTDTGAYSDALKENADAHAMNATSLAAQGVMRQAEVASLKATTEATAELTDHQKELIASYQEALTPAVEGFTGAIQMWIPAGETMLNVLAQMGDGQGIGNFVAGLDEAGRALNSVISTMGQIEALGQSLGAAQQVAQNLVGDPGVYAVVDDLLAKGLITREQLIAAQADEIRVVQANTAAQDALNTMRLAQMDALANTSEEYSAYLVTLSKLPAAEQAHALAMLDAGNQAKVATAYSAAYSAQLGEIPTDIATDIIANAARADPVLAGLLEDYGLIEMGAEGEVTVIFPDASQEALDRFKQVFEGAQVTTKEGLIEVRQSDGSTLVYDNFNNLVAQSGVKIPATVEISTTMPRAGIAGGYGDEFAGNIGTDVVKNISEQVKTADYTPVTTAINEGVSKAVSAVSPTTTDLDTAAFATSVITSVATSIIDAPGEEITTALEGVVSKAVTAASTTALDATAIGNDLVVNAAKGITDKAADFDTAAKTMVTDAVKNANTEAATSDTAGIEFVAQAKNGLTNDDDTFVSAGTDMVSTAVNDAKAKAADALSVGQEFVAQGTSGITQDGGNFSTQGQTMVSDAVTNAKTTAATAIDIGSEFVTQATAGINNNKQTFADAGSQMVKDAINAAAQAGAGILATGEAIGRDLGQGLINGMAAMVGEVQAQAAALAAAAEQGARTRLGTRSPSKVFYSIGVDTVQGFINAIHDRINEVFKALGLLGDEATNAFEDSLGKASYDAGADAGKRLKEGVNAETADTTDIAVGSDEWYAALHDNIMGHFENMGREGGKSLKKGLDEEVKSSSIMDSLTELVDINSALQGTADAWGGIEQAISASGISSKDATTAISAMAEELRRVGSGNKELTYMADQFDLLVTDIRQAGGTMDTELLDRVGRLGKELPFALENAGMAFGRFGKMSADEVVKSMAQMIEGISATLRELVDVVREAFGLAAKEGTDAFAGVVEPGLKTAIQNSGKWIADGAKDWESALITTGEWAGQTIGEAMANGMSAKEADWLNQMGFVVDRAIKKGVEGGKKGGSIGEETVKQAGEGVRRKERDYQDRMTEMVSKGADAGKAAATEFTDVGAATVDATTKGMQSEQLDLLKSAETTVKALLKVFGDRVQAFYDIGKNFAEGLALGMQAGAAEVQAAANDLGKSAEKELRKATESASPSKAADRVGKDVGKGFAEGIASGGEMTAKAAQQLWRAAWKELKDNIKEGGFLGRDWAVEFWEGMLNSPDMTGPLAQWITEKMVAAADTALKKVQAKIAGIAAQLDIARGLSDSDIEGKYPAIDRPELVQPVDVPQVDIPQPDPVDTSQRDMMQEQLEATRDLTDAITKAFEQAFSAAHKAHIAFVQGTISEEEYLSKYQAAQSAYNAKKANATKIESLEAQIKALEKSIAAEEKARKAAYDQQVAEAKATYDKQVADAKAAADAENAARQAAYDEAVRQRQAQIDAEKAARDAQIRELEQAQRDAQMEMTQAVIDESNQRIAQYQKELSKTNDPQQKAELKAKIALEKERIDVANQLAEAIGKANASVGDMDAMAQANAQIQMLIEKLSALGDVDVGGMLQGIADAIMAAAEKIAQAADKMKNAFKGGGGGGKGEGSKNDKGDKGTQDASDPSLSGGGGMGGGGMADDIDNIGKAAERNTPKMVDFGEKGAAAGRNIGTGFGEGTGVADKAIQDLVANGTVKLEGGFGDAGTRAGKKMADNVSISIADGTPMMSKSIDTSVEAATVNGEKIGADRGKHIGVTIGTNMETGVVEKTRDVEKSVNGVVTESTSSTIPLAEKGGQEITSTMLTFMSKGINEGTNGVSGDAKKMMDTVGKDAQQVAQTQGKSVGDDFSSFTAKAVDQGAGEVKRAGKDIMDGAGAAAKQDANRLGKEAGDDLGRGVADGIRNQIQNVRDAGRDLSNAARDSVQKAGEIRSPSKVMMRLGKAMGDGYVIGIEDRIADAHDAARALVYTPQGLPGGELRAPGGNQGGNGQGGRAVTVNFNGPVNLPQVRDPEDFWPAVENLMRTHGVSSGRP